MPAKAVWPFFAAVLWACAVVAGEAHHSDHADHETGTPGALRFSGILIGTCQSASESMDSEADVNGEANAQPYLFAAMQMGPGAWSVEVRGGTTPQSDGVTSVFPEANATVGETLDREGDGR